MEATAAHVLQTINGGYPGGANFHSLLGMASVALDLAVPELPAQPGEPPVKTSASQKRDRSHKSEVAFAPFPASRGGLRFGLLASRHVLFECDLGNPRAQLLVTGRLGKVRGRLAVVVAQPEVGNRQSQLDKLLMRPTTVGGPPAIRLC